MKKIFAIISMLLVVASLTACAPKAEEQVVITFKQNKPEIDEALQAYAASYEEATGVKVNVVSCGGSSCALGDMLKADFAAGEMPDIFPIDGPDSYAQWEAIIADLSGEKWVDDTSVEYVVNGKVVGFPVAVEGWGMAYNADLLAKAGIDPTTLTSYQAYVDAFAKIDGMKAELGIDSVVSMTAGPGMYWVTAHHNFNSLLSNGLPYSDLTVANDLLAGKIDEARITDYANWVNLLFMYADKTVLTTGNYDSQVGAFLNQKAVFLHQGNWVDGNLTDATFDMAFAPHGSSTAVTDGIFVSAPAWYVVNKDSKNYQAALDFLSNLVYTDLGQSYMVEKAGMIPAFGNIALQPKGKLSQSVQEWTAEGKVYSWNQYLFSGEFRDNVLGPIYDQLAQGAVTVEEFKELLKTALTDNAK
jgi:raffinose/stachyose/melibiose transport system substrate-binding protein